MRVIATIQARMSSTRLPGKVLKLINGKSLLEWQIIRLKKSRLLDDIYVATTNSLSDIKIVDFCKKKKIKFFRGSENDVLSRISNFLSRNNNTLHVELYGDSPLIDPHIVDEFIGFMIKNLKKFDCISNTVHSSYPPGQEFLVYKSNVLLKANKLTKKSDKLREHCGYNIIRNFKKFNIHSMIAPKHYNYPNIFLEVDSSEDFKLIKQIINYFYKKKIHHFSLSQILEFFHKYPWKKKINNKVKRKWKDYRFNIDKKI